MHGTRALTDALKRLLKTTGLTYADAAVALDLSEASVKRLFSEHSFTLARMETLCRLADAELIDLVRIVDDDRDRIRQLSEEQEDALAGDLELLVAAICTLNRYRFEDVLFEYRFDRYELQQLFARLDRLGLIELLAGNRYRLRVSRDLSWRAGGPIERFFVKSIVASFLDRQLLREQDHFRFAWGTVSDETAQRFVEKIRVLAEEFNEAADRDAQLPLAARHGAGLMLALKQRWVPADLQAYRRDG